MRQLTEKEKDRIAKEICFYVDNGIACNVDCDNCDKWGSYKKYKLAAEKVIKLWKKIENGE